MAMTFPKRADAALKLALETRISNEQARWLVKRAIKRGWIKPPKPTPDKP
jgi:hypothetical protein